MWSRFAIINSNNKTKQNNITHQQLYCSSKAPPTPYQRGGHHHLFRPRVKQEEMHEMKETKQKQSKISTI